MGNRREFRLAVDIRSIPNVALALKGQAGAHAMRLLLCRAVEAVALAPQDRNVVFQSFHYPTQAKQA